MDVNKDQKLAPKELDCVLRALGINATEADLIEFIGERKCIVKTILNPIFSVNHLFQQVGSKKFSVKRVTHFIFTLLNI